MKKIMLLIMALMLTLSFTACGLLPLESAQPKTTGTNRTTGGESGGTDFGAIFGGTGGNGVYGEMSPADKQEFIKEAKEQGVDVTFNADGTTTFKSEDGEAKQNADGSWTVVDQDGNQSQYGGQWPENEYTKQVPKPEFGTLLGAGVEEGQFYVAFTGGDMASVKEYVQKVKAAGFTIDAETQEESVFGLETYEYTAFNTAGYKIEVGFSYIASAITISKGN